MTAFSFHPVGKRWLAHAAAACVMFMAILFWNGTALCVPGHVGRWQAENRLVLQDNYGNPFITDYFMDVGIDSQGSVIVVALSGRVMKYTAQGQLAWEKRFNTRSDFLVASGLAQGEFAGPWGWDYITTALDIVPEDGSILVAGYRGANAPTSEKNREFVLRLDGSSGNLIWYRDIGPVDWDDFQGMWPYPKSYIPQHRDEGPDICVFH